MRRHPKCKISWAWIIRAFLLLAIFFLALWLTILITVSYDQNSAVRSSKHGPTIQKQFGNYV